MKVTSLHRAISNTTGLSVKDVQKFYSQQYLQKIKGVIQRKKMTPEQFLIQELQPSLNNSTFWGGKRGAYDKGKPFVSSASLFQVDLPAAWNSIMKNFRNDSEFVVSDIACGAGASTISVAAIIQSTQMAYKGDAELRRGEGLTENDLNKPFHVTGYDPNQKALDRAEQRQYSLDEINNGYYETPEMRSLDEKYAREGIENISRQVAEDDIRQRLEQVGIKGPQLEDLIQSNSDVAAYRQQLLPDAKYQVNGQINGIHQLLTERELMPKMTNMGNNQYKLGEGLSSVISFKKMSPFDFSEIPESHLISSFRFLSHGSFLSDAGVAEVLNRIASRLPDRGIFFTDWRRMGGLSHEHTKSLQALQDNKLLPSTNLPGILSKQPKVKNFV